jgi:hypothetical protein
VARLLALCLFVLVASAQTAGVEQATSKLWETGVVGAFCVLLIAALVAKDRQLAAANTRHDEQTEKANERYVQLALDFTKQIALYNERLEASGRHPTARGP